MKTLLSFLFTDNPWKPNRTWKMKINYCFCFCPWRERRSALFISYTTLDVPANLSFVYFGSDFFILLFLGFGNQCPPLPFWRVVEDGTTQSRRCVVLRRTVSCTTSSNGNTRVCVSGKWQNKNKNSNKNNNKNLNDFTTTIIITTTLIIVIII